LLVQRVDRRLQKRVFTCPGAPPRLGRETLALELAGQEQRCFGVEREFGERKPRLAQ
jgi:hypothetical protein